jgi:Lipase (class 3)
MDARPPLLCHNMPACAAQEPDLAASVAAVYTWGEPRVGDSKFRDVFNAAYGDRCFRVRNAGDIAVSLLSECACLISGSTGW